MAKMMGMPSIDKDWQTESDLRTIRQAEEIKANTARMTAVKKMAKKEQSALQTVGKAPAAPKSSARSARGKAKK
jgi:hypothetical protein